jgi:hypothetical protein
LASAAETRVVCASVRVRACVRVCECVRMSVSAHAHAGGCARGGLGVRWRGVKARVCVCCVACAVCLAYGGEAADLAVQDLWGREGKGRQLDVRGKRMQHARAARDAACTCCEGWSKHVLPGMEQAHAARDVASAFYEGRRAGLVDLSVTDCLVDVGGRKGTAV